MTATSINKILIANRGEIARRIMRTCREMGIATVAVFSEADRDAPFVREADEVVPLGGTAAGRVVSARSTPSSTPRARPAATPIHPGYGFLAENAEFARACQQAGLMFIGPPAEVIAAMGSKIEAKRRMQAAGVPVLPSVEVGSQSAEHVSAAGRVARLAAVDQGLGRRRRARHAHRARRAAELAALLETARRESQAAFGDGALFVEPYVEAARHVEIQIFGDTHGNVVHLFERECSIQRRHQKIIEESPSTALDDELRRAMADAAVRGGQGDRLRRRRHRRVPADARRQVLLPGSQHPPASRASGHRMRHGAGPGAAADPGRGGRAAAGGSSRADDCAATPSKPGCTPRIRGTTICPSAGKLHRFRIPRVGRACASIRRSAKRPSFRRTTIRCWPR